MNAHYHHHCRRSIESTLSFLVSNLSDVSQLAAQTERLDALLAALVQQPSDIPGGILR